MRRQLTNCSVIPCDGRPAIEDAEILIDGNRIEAVDRRSTLAPLVRDAEDHMRSYQLALQAGVKMAMGTDMLPADPYDGTLAVYPRNRVDGRGWHAIDGCPASRDAECRRTVRSRRSSRIGCARQTGRPDRHAR
jgi:hypothetical protein